MVAVGERGIIVLSDDRGTSWTQAPPCPPALLTGVFFADAQLGWAVGHDEAIVATADGGATWQRVHYAPEAQRPLLDVWCGGGGRVSRSAPTAPTSPAATAARASASDKFSAAAPPRPAQPPVKAATAADAGGTGPDYHLNASSAAACAALHRRRGRPPVPLRRRRRALAAAASPYEGSFFGVLPLDGDALLAFGLRGHLFRSDDAGASWRAPRQRHAGHADGGTPFGSSGVASSACPARCS